MKALFLLSKSNFRSKKWLTILTGLSITMAVVLFNSGIGILQSIQKPFDQLFSKLNASHILLLYDRNDAQNDKYRDWLKQQPEVLRVSEETPYFLSKSPLIYKEGKIEGMVQLTEYGSDNAYQDKLAIIEGKKQTGPDIGEIWIPKYLANNYQIHIGDTIGIPGASGLYPVVVSATVADPLYGSGMINPTRVWLSSGELPFFVPIAQLKQVQLGVVLKDIHSIDELWERFSSRFNYTGVHLTYSLFKNAYEGVYDIMGNIILLFSLLALLIALLMVHGSIKRAVYEDYKFIGVYRSLGFTPKNIAFLYVLQYFLLSILFIPVGLAISFLILKQFFGSIAYKLGGTSFQDTFSSTNHVITFIVIAGMIVLTSLAGSIKAARIHPAKALSAGTPVKMYSSFLLPKDFIRSFLSLPCMMGFRFFSSNPKRTLVQAVIIMFTLFMISFSIGISSSLDCLNTNKSAWGFEEEDIQISRQESIIISMTNEQLMEILLKEKSIKSVVPFSFKSLSILSNKYALPMEIYGKVYSDSISHTGLINLVGRHPQLANEISLCAGTARQFNRKPGDSISVFLEGLQLNFIVTGIYQDVSNMGQGFRLHTNAILPLNPIYSPNIYSIKLKDNTNKENYKRELIQKMGETISIDGSIEDRIERMGIISNMKTVLFALSFFFIGIMLLTIGTDIIVSIKEHQTNFGTLKSIGWTPFQIRMIIVIKNLIIFFVALLFITPLSLWGTPIMMTKITSGIGLVRFPFVADYSLLAIGMFLTMLLMGGCSWWLSKGAALTHPQTLIHS